MCFCQNGQVYAISINISLRCLPGRFFFVEKGLKGWLTPRNTEPPRSGRFQPGWQSLDRRQHIELLLSLRLPSSWLETCFQHFLSTRWQVALPWASEWTLFCLKLQFSLCSMNYLEGFVKHTPMPWINMSFIEILQAKTTSWCRILAVFHCNSCYLQNKSHFSPELSSRYEVVMSIYQHNSSVQSSFSFPK